jgi:hypothetical protein
LTPARAGIQHEVDGLARKNMNLSGYHGEPREFRPAPQYVTFLWVGVFFINFGLFYLSQMPWYRREALHGSPWLPWILFDLLLIIGTIHAARFRVRIDRERLEFLSWNFQWKDWRWDEITRLERTSYRAFLSRWLGNRYRVSRGRESFGFTAATLEDASALSAIIQDAADLDDMGEVDISLQDGVRHVWTNTGYEDI